MTVTISLHRGHEVIAHRITAVLIATLGGCSSVPAVVDGYDGPARDNRALAVLFTPAATALPEAQNPARLTAVDGRVYGDVMHGYPWATRVLPGNVRLKLNCPLARRDSGQTHQADRAPQSPGVSQRAPRYQPRLIQAPLEAGHYYALVCHDFQAEAVDYGTDYDVVKRLLPAVLVGELSGHDTSHPASRSGDCQTPDVR